ncbi:MAG TPA: 16S rRNA (uracil(1498)-N(3))-methyltransferase [Bacteroidales bacterium]|nr:16S rRNA (uracil(1498)-N(3))-methyltransferase [Bacteroidales bacterium]
MQVFYAPDISGSQYILDENESKHIIRVLRMGRGTAVRLIDGRGNLFEGVIEEPDHKHCKISITGVLENFEKRSYRLHIAISPIKNNDRFEWFIEKSVEIGVDEITPLICRNTEKTSIKTERINNIIISAMKQSLKSTLTKLNEPESFEEFTSRKSDEVSMIAHCSNEYPRKKISDICKPHQDAIILIGPEGDFSNEEIALAYNRGFTGIHLGASRLRTETAGVAACHSVYFINQE